jgi:hypothetical protein
MRGDALSPAADFVDTEIWRVVSERDTIRWPSQTGGGRVWPRLSGGDCFELILEPKGGSKATQPCRFCIARTTSPPPKVVTAAPSDLRPSIA